MSINSINYGLGGINSAGDLHRDPPGSRVMDVRLEGVTLRVANVRRSIDFYRDKLGFALEIDKAPQFAMLRVGGAQGGTIGLLPIEGAHTMTADQAAGIHLELTTDNLDALFQELQGRGVEFFEPPHDEPWERSASARDPDGYTVEFAEGRRGHRGVT